MPSEQRYSDQKIRIRLQGSAGSLFTLTDFGSASRVLAVTWIVESGSEDRVKDILRSLARETSREPGCLKYVVHQATDDPTHFFLYEVYRDTPALRAHSESEHFKRYVLGEAAPLLRSRNRVELSVVAN